MVLVIKSTSATAGNAKDAGSIHGSGRSPEEGSAIYHLQYSCLENPMDRGACQAMGSQRAGHDWASTHAYTHTLALDQVQRWCPPDRISVVRKRESGELSLCLHKYAQGRSYMIMQQGGGCLQTKKRGLRVKPALLVTWSWTSQVLELWEISFCFLSHSVYDICYGNLRRLISIQITCLSILMYKWNLDILVKIK